MTLKLRQTTNYRQFLCFLWQIKTLTQPRGGKRGEARSRKAFDIGPLYGIISSCYTAI